MSEVEINNFQKIINKKIDAELDQKKSELKDFLVKWVRSINFHYGFSADEIVKHVIKESCPEHIIKHFYELRTKQIVGELTENIQKMNWILKESNDQQ